MSPSLLHEALLLLFRNRPTLAPEVLQGTLGVPLPAFTEARIESGDLTEVVPRERRADQVVVLYQQRTAVLSIVVEAHLRPPDVDKRIAWVAYVAGSFSRNRCQACLLVVTTDPAVAARSAEPIEVGPGSVIGVFVLGPAAVPVITAPEQARAMPDLAVLSAMAHGRSEAGRAAAPRAAGGCLGSLLPGMRNVGLLGARHLRAERRGATPARLAFGCAVTAPFRRAKVPQHRRTRNPWQTPRKTCMSSSGSSLSPSVSVSSRR